MDNNFKYMPNELNKFLNGVTKRIAKPMGFDKMMNEKPKKREVEYASSLPLQIILYFNVYYSICWIVGTIFLWPILVTRSNEASDNDESRVWIILILFAFGLMVIFELIRLYLGYIGNLCERVPELTGFWLITLIIETPLSVFLIAIVWANLSAKIGPIVNLIPMQFALQLIHFIFVLLETIFGFVSLRVLARYQIARFHYKQFDNQAYNSNEAKNEYDNNSPSFPEWLTNLDKTNNFNMKSLKKDF